MKFITTSILLIIVICSVASQSISGIVQNENQESLEGVAIVIANTDNGTTTNENGYFKLKLNRVGEKSIIRFRYVGYVNIEQLVTGVQNVDLGIITMHEKAYQLESLTISSLRVNEDTPFTFQNICKEEIEQLNLGQDIPQLLNFTPSIVATSDAGAGIGYTALRIRGSDASRVNVTINGIPYNDGESQQVFWVDLPDFASSTQDIQIQRGVGTSTNGAGAFGASINLNTFTYQDKPYAKLDNSIGSFNTRKHSLSFGTGLMNNHFNFEGRMSLIKSDGFINRASSDLKSYFLGGSFQYDNGFVRFTSFNGHEITYQSWNGTPESRALNDAQGMNDYCARNFLSVSECQRLFDEGREYNFYTYENQVDNYQQNHFQLHANHIFSSQVTASINGHYTLGQGFFEQFKDNEDFLDYGIAYPVINGAELTSTNLVRRRWLGNDFYGLGLNLRYDPSKDLLVHIGTAWNKYEGFHFGEIIKADIFPQIFTQQNYYDNLGKKQDFHVFTKLLYSLNEKLSLFGDLQFRNVSYHVTGIDNDLRTLDVDADFSFFNPKAGVNYRQSDKSKWYASIAIANREPDRNDFVDALNGMFPEHESLTDIEFGYSKIGNYSYGANIYFMKYKNQLVLTGSLNDVGSPIRTNVDDSHRLGVEFYSSAKINQQFSINANLTLSQNKIKVFDELIYDYTNGFDIITNPYQNTDISFSPVIISSSILTYRPIHDFKINWYSKFVGDQFLDNTSSDNKKIAGFNVHNLQLIYKLNFESETSVAINLLVNNVFAQHYSTNGYTYSFVFGNLVTENFLYPQAARNFLLGLSIKI